MTKELELNKLKEECNNCQKCALGATRTNIVFSDGNPNAKIVLTTGTVTGQEIAHKKLADSVDFITYFPADCPFIVENFLNKIKPSMVFIAETEIWPYFASVCKRRNIQSCRFD